MTALDPAQHLPDLEANAAIRGLSADVKLYREPSGIPHIKADTVTDAFAALGFVHAQDRLWQMEALFRRGTGRFAEWLGSRALAGDVLARQLNTAGASRRDYTVLRPDTKAMLDAYARGVNAFIALKRWPVEYAVLGTMPQKFEPWHAIAIMRQIGFLMGSVWWKLWRAAALPIVGAAQVTKLRFDDGGDDLLCLPPGEKGGRYLAALADLRPGLSALLGDKADPGGAELAGGSNNWALSPSRTATGRPIVAGDPHRQLEMPSMYYQAHLACDEFDCIGLTVPGVPGFPHFGHTAHVAWGVTHAFVDIHDLYLERFDDGAQRYLHRDSWLPVAKREEEIAVKGTETVKLEVLETRHGPVIAGDPAAGTAITLRSTQFAVIDKSFDCLVPMLKATGDQARLLRGDPRLGPDRPQPCRRRYRRPYRPPRSRAGAKALAQQRLAAGARLDRRARMAGHVAVRGHAVPDRSARWHDRHRQQPRRRGGEALPVDRRDAAASRAPHRDAAVAATEGNARRHAGDPSRPLQHPRHRVA